MYFVYILESIKDNSLYIGCTNNLERRLNEHNSGKSRYTNQHKPYRLISYVALLYKSDAERFEKYLKSGYGRRTISKMLKDYFTYS